MTILQYKTHLEAATTGTFIFGFSWDVNLEHKNKYPIIRAYPQKWGISNRESFKIKQEFFIYNIGITKEDSWDVMIAIWNAYVAILDSHITVNKIDGIELFPLGQTVEQGQAIKIIADLTIWC